MSGQIIYLIPRLTNHCLYLMKILEKAQLGDAAFDYLEAPEVLADDAAVEEDCL